MNNIHSLHEERKAISAKQLFKSKQNTTISIQIHAKGLLDKHVSKVPALLLCISGEIMYDDENRKQQTLKSGDYCLIEPMVTHWVKGVKDSQLILIK